MTITSEKWKEIEKQLANPHGRVELLCDGFRVALVVELVAKLRYGIVTYVNGEWRGVWMKGEAEEAKRFLRPMDRFLYSPKYRKEMIKIYGGKRCPKAKLEDINKKLTTWTVEWNSVKAMRRHFEKNNKSLEVVRIGYPTTEETEAAA